MKDNLRKKEKTDRLHVLGNMSKYSPSEGVCKRFMLTLEVSRPSFRRLGITLGYLCSGSRFL